VPLGLDKFWTPSLKAENAQEQAASIKGQDRSTSSGKKGQRDTSAKAFVDQDIRALQARQGLPFVRPVQAPLVRGSAVNRGAMLKLSVVEPRESKLIDVFALGLFVVAFCMLALTGCKKLRILQNPMRAMQKPLMLT